MKQPHHCHPRRRYQAADSARIAIIRENLAAIEKNPEEENGK